LAFPPIKASSKGGKDFELVPPGIHLAICQSVVHLGIQPSNNAKFPDKDQVYLRFEIPGVRVKWEKKGEAHEGSAMIGTFFTLSISEKSNLRPFLVGWRGKEFTPEEEDAFDITSIIGKVCQLSVIHEQGNDGKTRAKIQGAFGLIQEQKDKLRADPRLGQVTSPDGLIVYTPESHDQVMWERLPEWLQKKIDGRVKKEAGPDYSQSQVPKDDFDDDIPF
jgi:hypothetical protein